MTHEPPFDDRTAEELARRVSHAIGSETAALIGEHIGSEDPLEWALNNRETIRKIADTDHPLAHIAGELEGRLDAIQDRREQERN